MERGAVDNQLLRQRGHLRRRERYAHKLAEIGRDLPATEEADLAAEVAADLDDPVKDDLLRFHRALVDGLWVEVPTYRNARRTIERARRLQTGDAR